MKISILHYDGFNLFKNGKWTTVAYPTKEKALEILEFLKGLSEDKVDEFIKMELKNK